MKNSGKKFERLAADLYELFTTNESYTNVSGPRVILNSPDGKREFDIVLRSSVAGMELLTVIECRDYNKKLDVTHIDGFYSKMTDVNANNGAIVSRRGFSNTAIKKARRLGITLCVAHDMNSLPEDIINVGLDVPILIKEIDGVHFYVGTSVTPAGNSKLTKKELFVINDVHVWEIIKTGIALNKVPVEISNQFYKWEPYPKEKLNWIRDDSGTKINIGHITIFLKIESITYYFGFSRDLPNIKAFFNLSSEEKTVVVDEADFASHEYRKSFAKFHRYKDIPVLNSMGLSVLIPQDYTELQEVVYDKGVRKLV